MNTAEVIVSEVCGTALLFGAGAFVIARKAVNDLIFAWHRALAEGWVEGVSTLRIVPLAKRIAPTPKDAAEAVTADAADAAASVGQTRSLDRVA